MKQCMFYILFVITFITQLHASEATKNLYQACISKNDDISAFSAALNEGADIHCASITLPCNDDENFEIDYNSPLATACAHDNYRIACMLIKNKATIDHLCVIDTFFNKNNYKMLNVLIKNGITQLTFQKAAETLIQHASQYAQVFTLPLHTALIKCINYGAKNLFTTQMKTYLLAQKQFLGDYGLCIWTLATTHQNNETFHDDPCQKLFNPEENRIAPKKSWLFILKCALTHQQDYFFSKLLYCNVSFESYKKLCCHTVLIGNFKLLKKLLIHMHNYNIHEPFVVYTQVPHKRWHVENAYNHVRNEIEFKGTLIRLIQNKTHNAQPDMVIQTYN